MSAVAKLAVERAIRDGVLALSAERYRDVFSEPGEVSVRIETPRSLWHLQSSHQRYRCTISGADRHRRERKVLVHGKRAPEAEYENLRYLRELFADSGTPSTPQALGYLGGSKILLMEHVEGRPLMNLLLRYCLPGSGGRTTSLVERALGEAGSWLAGFHNRTMEGPHYGAGGVEKLAERLRKTGCFHGSRMERICQAVTRSSSDVGRIPSVAAHGEFGPRNILVAEDRITVIDWPHLVRHNAFFDTHLFLQSVQGLARMFPWAGKRLDRACEMFADAFTRSLRLDPADRLLERSRLVNLVEILLRSHRRLKHARTRLVLARGRRYVSYLKGQVALAGNGTATSDATRAAG